MDEQRTQKTKPNNIHVMRCHYPIYLVTNLYHMPTNSDENVLVPDQCYMVPMMAIPQCSTTVDLKLDDMTCEDYLIINNSNRNSLFRKFSFASCCSLFFYLN